jgi:hypothetical protein
MASKNVLDDPILLNKILSYLDLDGYYLFTGIVSKGWMESVVFSKETKLSAFVETVEALKYGLSIFKVRYKLSTEACDLAAKIGHLDVLQYARVQRCHWSTNTCSAAAGGGHLEVLQWLRSQGCPWDEETCSFAARYGHFDILKWAYENGACLGKPLYDENDIGLTNITEESAAEYGNLEIYNWVERHLSKQSDGGWSGRIQMDVDYRNLCIAAASGGNLDILKQIYNVHSWRELIWDNPYYSDDDLIDAATGHADILLWLDENLP